GTNAVGFKATVSQGKRITMLCSSAEGKITFSGRPAVLLVGNYGGAWNGLKQQNDQSFVEIFNMTLSGGPGPNLYTVSGNGAGYSYSGIAIISKQGKIAFSLPVTLTSGESLRATFGSFSLGSARGNTTGWDQGSGFVSKANKAKFKVEQQPAP